MAWFKSKKFLIPFISISVLVVGSIITTLSLTVFTAKARLNTYANSISEKDINLVEINNNNQILNKANTYAFNVLNSQLKLNENVYKNGYELNLKLDHKKDAIAKSNDGILQLILNVKDSLTNDEVDRQITISGFKKADTKLLKALDLKNEQYSLDLTSINQEKTNYWTIEDINDYLKKDETNNPFKELVNKKLNGNELANTKISGEIKLDQISNVNNQTKFELVTSEKSLPIKLTKTENGNIFEAAIPVIEVNNLLATSIHLIPKYFNVHTTKAFKSLIQSSGEDSLYFDESLDNRAYVEITNDGKVNEKNKPLEEKDKKDITRIYLDPFVSNNQIQTSFNVHIKVIFGLNDLAKEYDGMKYDEAKILNENGFSFAIYGKRLSKDIKNVVRDDVSNEAELLKDFFENKRIKTLGDRSTQTEANNKMLSFNEVKSIDPNQTIVINQPSNLTNATSLTWLVGVDYRYNGIEANKVFLSPNINVIHLL